jgi:hypothetical protein
VRPCLVFLALCIGCDPFAAPDPCVAHPEACAFESYRAAGPMTAAEVYKRIEAEENPVVRSAMLTLWLDKTPNVDRATGEQLCGLLAPADAQACTRRVVSAHLAR